MSTAVAEVVASIDLDDEPTVDDVPDDFFEDFEKNEFLDGLEVLDDLSPGEEDRRRHRSMSGGFSSGSSNFGLVEKQSHVLNEIKKLERDIAERRRKLCRTRSPRSPASRPRRRSLSRRRQSGRSRSRSRGRRNRPRSRSRNRRSRSRGRTARNQNLPERRRDRPKTREKVDPTGRKSLSFLEELSQKFAEQGKAFPEGEGFDINAVNNYNMPSNNFANSTGPFPNMFNPLMGGQQPPPWITFNNPSLMGPGPPGMTNMPMPMLDPSGMQQMMMPPREQPVIAMDLESSNSNERMDTPPPPSIVKREFEAPNSRYCDTDEMIRKTFKESVLTRCRDVVNLLKASETQLVKPPNLHYIPTVISAALPKDTYLSPLQSIHNVQFSFNNQEKAPSYLKRLSEYTSGIVHTLGFNIKTAKFTEILPSTDETPLPDDAVPADMKFDIGTQTDPLHCERCFQNDLREFKDKTTQVAAITYHIGCQTSNEDPYSFAEMTPAQVLAISDFGKILKNGLMPTNYREATDLRDRLFNIYQTCTGLNKNSFLRDNENRINPGIFRDTIDRVVEPTIRDTHMVQNDMMRSSSDRFDSRQRSLEPQRFEPNRLDRGDQSFSRQSDPFQSTSIFNMSTNSQDRFMQTQSNDRFDLMTQSDQFNSMRNVDPRGIQQQDARGMQQQDARGMQQQDARGMQQQDARGMQQQDPRGILPQDPRGILPQDPRGIQQQDSRGIQQQNARGMQQQDVRGIMHHQDLRGMQQQSQTDFGNRISDQQSMSSNRYDTNQESFSSLLSASISQQPQSSGIWASGQRLGGQSLSSLSPLGNNLRPLANEDFARRQAPQPLFPDTSSGVMTCKQIMEMERGSGNRNQPSNQQINNNLQFDNINSLGRNIGGGDGAGVGGGGGRGNRGAAANRIQPLNRFNRGGGGNPKRF